MIFIKALIMFVTLVSTIATCEYIFNLVDRGFKNRWIKTDKEDPQYYVPVLVKAVDVEGEFQAVAWRASDGDDSYYTIYRTQVIINGKVLSWKNLK